MVFPSVLNAGQSYALGLISTDGHIDQSGAVVVGLVDRDAIEHLAEIFCRGTITSCPPRGLTKRVLHVIRIGGGKANLKPLGLYNLYPGKKVDLQPPDINRIVVSDFIRGLLDGNGSWSVSNSQRRRNCLTMQFVMPHRDYVYWLAGLISEIVGEKLNVCVDKHGAERGKMTVYRIKFCGRKAVTLANAIYTDCPYRMERKYQVVRPFLRHHDMVCSA